MAKGKIAELKAGDHFEACLVIRKKELKPTREGNDFFSDVGAW